MIFYIIQIILAFILIGFGVRGIFKEGGFLNYVITFLWILYGLVACMQLIKTI